MLCHLGSGGNGKSTAMKHLAKIWAEGSSQQLNIFDFVFHVALNTVQSNEDIENIIIEQHKGLKGNDVKPTEIKAIIRGPQSQKVVIIFDGHDEYKCGTNFDIDHAITKEYLRDCLIILSSRETEVLREIREIVDTEVEITGFDSEGVKEYAAQYFLEMPEKCEELLEKVEACEINNSMFDYGILHIPIFLNMTCVLFKRNVSVLKGKVAVLSAIVDRCPAWQAIRTGGKKGVKDTKDVIIKLGKLALDGLLQEPPKQVFSKVW